MKKQRICIVGDGLSGLMTALALNKLEGLEIHLVSRKNKYSRDRRTTAISASNYEFFNKVIGKLKKASKAHASQAKTLTKIMKDQKKGYKKVVKKKKRS